MGFKIANGYLHTDKEVYLGEKHSKTFELHERKQL